MASDNSGGASKKLTTQEILAKARAEAAKKSAGGEAASPSPSISETSATPPVAAPATAAPRAASGAKPTSTAEILAAARAAKSGSAAPAAEAAPATPKPAVKPAATGAPKSTADILAAARANKTAGAASPAAHPAAPKPESGKPVAKPAAAKLAAPEPTSAAPAVSVEEMLAAVRPGGTSAAAKVESPSPSIKVAPPMPARPTPSAKPVVKKTGGETRRGFMALVGVLLSPFVLAWGAMAATAGVWTLGLARFMLPNVLTEPPSRFKIGPPTDYDLGTVATKWVAQFGIWIVHTDQYKSRNMIYALASVCTHLGCTPSWLEGERKFKCPCHGSGFYITGINFEGPAPRPLERVGIRLAEDGMLEVDKSVKFQEEMGQWNDGASFFEVTA